MNNHPINPIIIIPARMASTRLPGKPMAMIHGKPMIAHVVACAKRANLGPVLVACDGDVIANAAEAEGAIAIKTNPDHPSGSDRVHDALTQYDPDKQHDIVINLQGDLPSFDASLLTALMPDLQSKTADITTLVAPIHQEQEHTNPSVVKAILALKPGAKTGQALYFTRATAPYGEGVRFHHIGVYGYHRHSLERFVSLPPSPLETREKLEQLRALEDGMRIYASIVNTTPIGVDTEEDLAQARQIMQNPQP